MNHSFVLALSTLLGTIIGGGIFAIPYVMAQSGVLPALFYFLVLGAAVTLLHLFFGEVALRTRQKARLIGYAERYLGTPEKSLAVFSTLVGIIGSLLAYIIVGGTFLHILLGEATGVSQASFSLLLWAALSLFILRGIQLIARAEFFMNIALFGAVALVLLFALPHVQPENFSLLEKENLFLPYGVILFAFAGWAAIPEIADFFKNRQEKRNLDNLIVWAGAITATLFFLFALFVVGVSGENTSPDALTGLIPVLGKKIAALGAFFGLVAVAASFLVLGNYLKNSLRYDFRLPYILSAGVAVLSPLLLFVAGLREFVAVLGIVGIVLGVIESALIVRLFQRARIKGDREPEYVLRLPGFLPPLVALVLAGGAVAQLVFLYGR